MKLIQYVHKKVLGYPLVVAQLRTFASIPFEEKKCLRTNVFPKVSEQTIGNKAIKIIEAIRSALGSFLSIFLYYNSTILII